MATNEEFFGLLWMGTSEGVPELVYLRIETAWFDGVLLDWRPSAVVQRRLTNTIFRGRHPERGLECRLKLASALRVLADVSMEMHSCFHAFRILEFERLGDICPRFRSSTKAIVRAQITYL